MLINTESQLAGTENKSTKKQIVVIDLWMPFHEGHKSFLMKLAKDND